MWMRLTNKLVNDTIAQVVGEDVLNVVEYLKEKSNISEFKIAEALDEEVNRVRNMLYRLHTFNLVTYIRKKDKLKGWYISYWTLNLKTIKSLYSKIKADQIDLLKERLKKEEDNLNSYFICPSVCARLNFDAAMEFEFKCPECGRMMVQQDNSKTIVNLRERIQEIESTIEAI
jgi:transcription initiation factor TFIIE subunit alpha